MQFIQETLVFFFSLLFLYLVSIFIRLSPKKKLPPSPPRLPIIGNLHQLAPYPHLSLRTLSKKYGNLMLLHLGNKPAVIVSSAQVASQFLKTHDLIFASRPQLKAYKTILANGKNILNSPYGDYWRQMRSIWAQQLFGNQRVGSFGRVREEELSLMMKNIKGLSMVNLSETFLSLTNDIVCRLAFGRKCMGVKGGVDFKKLLNDIFNLLGNYYVGDFVNWLAWIDWVNGIDAKVSRVATEFDNFLEDIIQEHLVHPKERKDDEQSIQDFVDVLLDAKRVGFSLDRESIKGLVLDVFTAGTIPTAATLEWMMSELLRNPRVMKELQKEVRGITKDKKTVTEDDLKEMTYLKAVIKETLRLHPPAPVTPPHQSTEDVEVNGYDIAAGTLLIVDLWSISRDPTHWKEAESFYPERFLDSEIDFKGQDFELIPFGSGRRICPGMAFSVPNIEFAMANLVRHFDWALPNGVDEDS